jgi:SNF2 family DNA or RNA helicase
MPGLLGARKELEKSLIEDSAKTLLLLRRQVTPFVLRRMKNEVASELPPKLETELPCPLNDEQRKVYKALAEGGILEHGNNLKEAIRTSSMHVFFPAYQVKAGMLRSWTAAGEGTFASLRLEKRYAY